MTFGVLILALAATDGGRPPDASVEVSEFDVSQNTFDAGAGSMVFIPAVEENEKPQKLPFELRLSSTGVLAKDVYLAVLKVPPNAKPDAATADLIKEQLTEFLRKSGYSLAEVAAVAVEDLIDISIDEGQLEKVVFRGRLTFQMVRLRVSLDLPRDVFNAPSLDRQIDELAQALKIERPKWELIRSQTMRHLGPQLTDLSMLGTISGSQLVRPQQPYELHLFFTDTDWGVGPGIDLRTSYFDGFELGLNYQGRSALWSDDRWRAGLMAGLGLRNAVDDNHLYVFPSRVFAEVQWFTPALDAAGTFRPFVLFTGQGTARQRRDLNLENYYSTTSEISFNLSLPLSEWLSIYVAFGLQHFFLGGARAPEGGVPTTPIEEGARLRTYAQARFEGMFETGSGRWDRRHAGTIDARLYANLSRPDQPTFLEVRALYQKVFGIGWHDVWLRARGTYLAGDVIFPFEEPLGEFLRGLFGDVFTRAGVGAKGEFRFSLTRDLYKVGFFVDAAVYSEQERTTGIQRVRFGTAFGPSFHALIEGMFQMDLGISFGVLSSGRFNTGVHAFLVKVF